MIEYVLTEEQKNSLGILDRKKWERLDAGKYVATKERMQILKRNNINISSL